MATLRFILAFGELLLSPLMLILYACPKPNATNRASAHQLLDFSPRLS